ncbi:multiple sugar transport system substrate-binding protein [Thermocatellispora tengchongensis]|uniref:Multiple sugar transport system substrate-binding protein n=1 Tax=Thermocatellispora tengchongensis TaxID=1073253 RepID=A0A840PJ64_9ACTN|nr:extracellular solute-binding protein [Thermocatellispora tengchongensis]MBB5137137.1 multiple sugar transport system substrate-binding protein [Thermocatellispora tengchongensis]
MSIRSLRRLGALGLAGALLAATAACGGSSGGDDGTVELRFSWWGNNDRAAATQKVIDAFQKQNPGIKVTGSFADFNAYFDRLATEVASGDAPDVITLGGAYPREYGDRGALLDLATVKDVLKTDKIDKAALGNGNFGDTQYGVPSGVNAIGVVVDPVVFEKAGVELPDDETWTWDDFKRIAKEIAAKSPKGTFGLADPTKTDMLDIFSRQRGEALYTADGKVGISEQTLIDWWNMTLELRDSGATPSASQTAELITQPAPEQSLIGRGLAGMQFDWSNQIGALRKASGHPLRLMRVPGETGAKQPGSWLQASQLYTINAKTEHPKEAAKFVDFLVNSPEAGKIILTDRGIPSNSDVRTAIEPGLDEDQKVQVDYISGLTPKAGPPLVIGPTGSTDTPHILDRVNAEVLFNRLKPADAAKEFISQVTAAIQQ